MGAHEEAHERQTLVIDLRQELAGPVIETRVRLVVVVLHGDIRRAHIAPSILHSLPGSPVYLIDKYLHSQILSDQ
jgi:hypothetical protein